LENKKKNRTELQNKDSTEVAACAVKWKTGSGKGPEEQGERGKP
jgi:hypothetical protein